MTIDELEEQLRQSDASSAKQGTRINELAKQVEELKKLLVKKAKSKESKPPNEEGNYSVDRQERKQRKKRRRKKSTGRKPKDVKHEHATQTIDQYWNRANQKK